MDLSIYQLDCHYTVPRGAGNESAIRERMDLVATRLLSTALEREMDSISEEDGTLYFVDHMEMTVMLQPSSGDYDLAKGWAGSVSTGIIERIRRGEGVVVFRDRAELLASFLVDLAHGTPDAVWYYRRLVEPPGISNGDRARLLLMEDPDRGRDALHDLHARNRLEEVLQLFSSEQIADVVRRCLLPPSPEVVSAANYRRWHKAAVQALTVRRFVPSGSQARDTLLLYFEILAERADLGPDVNLARFIWRFMELGSICRLQPQLSAIIRAGDWARIRPLLDTGEQARFVGAFLQAVPAHEIASALEVSQTGVVPTVERLFITEFAGASLLVLASRSAEGDKLSAFARYLTLLQCLGASNLAETVADPGVAALAGWDGPPSPQLMAQHLSAWTPAPHNERVADPWFSLAAPGGPLEAFPAIDAMLQSHSRKMMGDFRLQLGAFSESSNEYIHRNLLRCRGFVALSPARMSVRFLACPLRVVLRMAGFASTPLVMPWAGSRLLEIDLD